MPRVTGFVVDDVDAAVECVVRAPGLSRKRCRERFEQRFQVERMSKNYCKAYELATKQTCWRMP